MGCCIVTTWVHASDTKPHSYPPTAQRVLAQASPWEQAERGREILDSIPEGSRTKTDFDRALDLFRSIYHLAPQDMHAAAAVNAVAELLAQEGRELHDAKLSKAAVGQYEFLRKEYPGSSLRVGALLAEAQIAENDLQDEIAARDRYELLLKQYPRSGQAEEARAGLAALGHTSTNSRSAGESTRPEPRAPQALSAAAARSATTTLQRPPDRSATVSGFTAMPRTRTTSNSNYASTSNPGDAPTAEKRGTSAPVESSAEAQTTSTESAVAVINPARPVVQHRAASTTGRLAVVTGIRHWSTPTYTRVAIDLGDDVTYEAARVPHPDRIYFDLHGTRLAQELVGKSFAVTDDGFLRKIRAAQFSNDMTRVVLDVNDVTEYSAFLLPNPYRLIIDIHGATRDLAAARDLVVAGSSPAPQTEPPAEAPAPRVAAAVKSTPARPVPNTVTTKGASTTEIASLSAQPGKVEATSVPTSQPISAVVKDKSAADKDQDADKAVRDTAATATTPLLTRKTRKGRTGRGTDPANALPARAAVPTADGQTSLVRALGLKIGRIVIDAGHGGHDSGTLGVDGLEEKDVVLDVALRLGKLLHDRLGAEIIHTRSDDTFIPLETRTAIANKAQADLFLSVHANSSVDASARGVETYYLNFTSSPDALETAARENAVSDQSIHQLSDLVKKIALKDKIEESREFASDVEQSLYGGLQSGNAGLKNRGVKKAPFVVLIGANMPSILAEISFVTNPRDASQLRQPDYRQRVAESLYKGVAKYAGGLSASKAPTERASAN